MGTTRKPPSAPSATACQAANTAGKERPTATTKGNCSPSWDSCTRCKATMLGACPAAQLPCNTDWGSPSA